MLSEKELKEIEDWLKKGDEECGWIMDAYKPVDYCRQLLEEVKRLREVEHFCYECHSDHSYGECPKEDNNP